jgi:hypothetical protein
MLIGLREIWDEEFDGEAWGGARGAAERTRRSGAFDVGPEGSFHLIVRRSVDAARHPMIYHTFCGLSLSASDFTLDERGRNALAEWMAYICDSCLRESIRRYPSSSGKLGT